MTVLALWIGYAVLVSGGLALATWIVSASIDYWWRGMLHDEKDMVFAFLKTRANQKGGRL